MNTLSIVLHWIEYYSLLRPWSYVLDCLSGLAATLAVISALMVLRRLRTHMAYNRKDPATGKPDHASVSSYAYGNGWLLRTSENPAWRGWFLLGVGLCLLLGAATQIDPREKTWAIAHELTVSSSPSPGLISMQQRWKELFASKNWSMDYIALPFGRLSQAEIAAIAASAQGRQRTWEGVGIGLLLLGLVLGLKASLRESLGGEDHGQATFAARADVVYTPEAESAWLLPLRVDQYGARGFEKITSAPFTAARPPLTTLAVHLVGIGNSGSGKGAFLAGHIFATDTNPIIYFDYKGEMPAYKLRPQMLRWGFPSQRPKGLPSLRLNLVDWVRHHEDPDTAAKILASAILPQNSKKESDNAWIKDTAIPILSQGFTMDPPRWANLAELADEVEHTPLMELLDNIEVGRGRMAAFQGKNVPEYAQNEISNNTAAYLSGRARHIVTSSDFTLDEAFRSGLYVMGQAGSPYERRVLTMLWNVFWAELLRKGDPMPLTVLVDEGVACGPVPRVEEALVTLRDRGISLIEFFQTRSGLTSVYGRDLADSVWDAHQTHIFLTKGLSLRDIKTVCEIAGTHTRRAKKDDGNPTKAELLPFDKFKAHCRQEKFWAFIEGVQWTKSGLPIFAELQPIPRRGWNWRATTDEYDAELSRLEYGVEHPSPFKMIRNGIVEATKEVGGKTQTFKFFHWVPAFAEAAAAKGITEKHVLIDESLDLYRTLNQKTIELEPDPVAAAYGVKEEATEADGRAPWESEEEYGL